MTDDISKVVAEMREQAQHGPTVDWRPNVFYFADRIEKALESATTPAEPTLAEIERAVATLPPGYAFADALEHATPAGIAANIPNPLLDPIQGPATTRAEVDAPELPEPVSSVSLAAWGPKPDYYTAEQMREYAATLARQLVEAKAEANDANMGCIEALDRAEQAESQLAEATRRLGEVERLLRECQRRLGAEESLRHMTYREWSELDDRIDAALTKEPTK